MRAGHPNVRVCGWMDGALCAVHPNVQVCARASGSVSAAHPNVRVWLVYTHDRRINAIVVNISRLRTILTNVSVFSQAMKPVQQVRFVGGLQPSTNVCGTSTRVTVIVCWLAAGQTDLVVGATPTPTKGVSDTRHVTSQQRVVEPTDDDSSSRGTRPG